HEEGLVQRRPHPTDRRVRTLWLTPAARRVVAQILAINKAIREEAFAGMAADARDTLIDILDGIKGNLVLREGTDDSPAAPTGGADSIDIAKLPVAASGAASLEQESEQAVMSISDPVTRRPIGTSLPLLGLLISGIAA